MKDDLLQTNVNIPSLTLEKAEEPEYIMNIPEIPEGFDAFIEVGHRYGATNYSLQTAQWVGLDEAQDLIAQSKMVKKIKPGQLLKD